MKDFEKYRCTIAITLEIIGGKWKSLILWHLSFKTLRFSQLQRRLGKVTQKMLTQQLRELESDGLIHRQVYAEVPPRVEYSLTELGQSVVPILQKMCEWGKDFLASQEEHHELEEVNSRPEDVADSVFAADDGSTSTLNRAQR